MKILLTLLAVSGLTLGCGTWYQYDPAVLIDGKPALVAKGRFGGQGHLSVKTEDGITTVEVVQFGVSDVLGGTIKGLFTAASGVFGGNAEPPQITINMPSMPDVTTAEVP
jgi:hypothetical protein